MQDSAIRTSGLASLESHLKGRCDVVKRAVHAEIRMKFTFRPMNKKYANAIAAWHYEGIYAFYDMKRDIDDLEELLNPQCWDHRYYAVTDGQGDLIGFFCFDREEETVVIGLGLKPDLTGKGWGQPPGYQCLQKNGIQRLRNLHD